jgi:hypothetical protein
MRTLSRPRWLAVAAFVVWSAVSCASCTTPTLPLPPPALPTVSVGDAPNTFTLRSDKGALPNALIIAVNRNETLSRQDRVAGTFADGEGSWQLVIHGVANDIVDVSQESEATHSPSTSVQLR